VTGYGTKRGILQFVENLVLAQVTNLSVRRFVIETYDSTKHKKDPCFCFYRFMAGLEDAKWSPILFLKTQHESIGRRTRKKFVSKDL
jgi:hypothetical protein